MLRQFITYNFDSKNTKSFILVPGYTGGFTVPIIKQLLEFLEKEKKSDVLGLKLDYKNDTLDLFDTSQQRIQRAIQTFTSEYPKKKVILIAKSLGGSLCLYSLEELSVSGLVVVGFPIMLGWPQHISLLGVESSKIPKYASEWSDKLKSLVTPVEIVNGGSDTLTDNGFLKKILKVNNNINLVVVPKAGHSLDSIETGEALYKEVFSAVGNILDTIQKDK